MALGFGLPEAVAERLTDQCGQFAYPDLVRFARLVTLAGLILAGHQVAPARMLLDSMREGGDIHIELALQGRLRLTKAVLCEMANEAALVIVLCRCRAESSTKSR